MILSSKYFFQLTQSCKFYFACLHREFSAKKKILSIKEQKIHKDGEKNTRESTEQKKTNKNENFKNNDYTESNVKVCIIGGGVTPLYTAILLKQYSIIKSINLVDTRDSMSIATVDTYTKTSPRINYFEKNKIKQALKEANVVAIMDEMDTTTDDKIPQKQFQSVADYMRHTTDQILRYCPDALLTIFAHPVTATLVMVSEIFRCSGWWNPDKIIGSTAAQSARIEETVATFLNLERASLSVPLAGGADTRTIVPLLSRAVPYNRFTNMQHKSLLQSFRTDGHDRRNMTGSFFNDRQSLSLGTTAAKLIIAVAGGLRGYDNIITCAYVRSNVLPVCRFFTSELQLGPGGIKRNLGLPKISPAEIILIEQAIPLINEYIDMAVGAVRTEKMRVKTQ